MDSMNRAKIIAEDGNVRGIMFTNHGFIDEHNFMFRDGNGSIIEGVAITKLSDGYKFEWKVAECDGNQIVMYKLLCKGLSKEKSEFDQLESKSWIGFRRIQYLDSDMNITNISDSMINFRFERI